MTTKAETVKASIMPKPATGQLKAFLIERPLTQRRAGLPDTAEGTAFPRDLLPVVMWVAGTPFENINYACECSRVVWLVHEESIAWLCGLAGTTRVRVESDRAFFVCPCMGRFID